jgi:hypothetical protein
MRVQSYAAVVAAFTICACGGSSGNIARVLPTFAAAWSSPAEGSAGVATNATFVVLFNRAPDLSSLTVAFSPLTAAAIAAAPGGAPGVSITASHGLAPGTAYSLTVNASDADGSPLPAPFVLQFTTAAAPDRTPPSQPDMTALLVGATKVQLGWTASGDDGLDGTAASREIRFESGAGCDAYTSASFSDGAPVALPPPVPGGTPETATVTGLSEKTRYCFIQRVADRAGNVAFSARVDVTTRDDIAPGTAVLSASNVTATGLTISWVAVGDDGATGGPAASYLLAFQSGSACQTIGLTFPAGTAVPTGTPKAPGQPESVAVTGLSQDTLYCFMLLVRDHASNSSRTAALTVNTAFIPPAMPTILASGSHDDASIFFQFLAVGADGGAGGPAAQYIVEYVGPVSTCPASETDFVSPQVLASPGQIPAPGVPGTLETITIGGLSPASQYCAAVDVLDASGHPSGFSPVAAAVTQAPRPSTPQGFTAQLQKHAPDNGAGPRQHVRLGWSAPHDAYGNKVAAYTIYAASNAGCPITAATLASAAVVPQALVPQDPQRSEELSFDFPAADSDALCFSVTSTDLAGLTSDLSPSPQPSLRVTSLTATSSTDIGEVLTFSPPVVENGAALASITAFAVPATGPCSPDSFDFYGLGISVDATNGPARFTGLVPGSTYCAGLVVDTVPQGEASDAIEGVGMTWSDAAAFTVADDTPPPAPQSLAVANQSDTSVAIRFAASADNGLAHTGVSFVYTVFTEAVADCAAFDPGSARSFTIDETGVVAKEGDPVQVVVGGLAFATHYCIAVVATNAEGHNSALSSVLSTRTAGPPARITDLRVTDLYDTTDVGGHFAHALVARWTAPGDFLGNAVASFDLRLGLNGDCPITQANFATLPSVDLSSLLVLPPHGQENLGIDAPLGSNADQQCLAMTATDVAGHVSAISDVAAAPRRIGDLHAEADGVSATGATLGFTAPLFAGGTFPGRYAVTYAASANCAGGPFVRNLSGAVTLDGGAAGPSSVALTGLALAAPYCASIDVSSADGDESFSDSTSFVTLDGSAPPPPANVAVSAATASSLTIQFDSSADNTIPATGVSTTYLIDFQALDDCSQFQSSGGGKRISVDESAVVTAAGQTVHATIPSLIPGTRYCLAVEAQNAEGKLSGHSAVVAATTARGGTRLTGNQIIDYSQGTYSSRMTSTGGTITLDKLRGAQVLSWASAANGQDVEIVADGSWDFSNATTFTLDVGWAEADAATKVQVAFSSDTNYTTLANVAFASTDGLANAVLNGYAHLPRTSVTFAKSLLVNVGSPDLAAIKHIAVRLVRNGTTNAIPKMYVYGLWQDVTSRPKVLLTFDDGQATLYTKIFSIMKAANMVGTAYLNGIHADTAGWFTTPQVGEMYAAGWDVGNHTWDHALPGLSFQHVSYTRSETTATFVFASAHHLTNGNVITIFGCDASEYNGTFTVTVVNSTTVTFTVPDTEPDTGARGYCAVAIDPGVVRSELGRNRDWILANGWGRAANHVAYPFGAWDTSIFPVLNDLGVSTARIVGASNTNTYNISTFNGLGAPFQLPGMEGRPGVTGASILAQVDAAIASNATFIFFSHGLDDTAPISTQMLTSEFQALIDGLAARRAAGQIDIVTISNWYNNILDPTSSGSASSGP